MTGGQGAKGRLLRGAAAGLDRRAAHPVQPGEKPKRNVAGHTGRRPYAQASASGPRQGSKPGGPRRLQAARFTRARRPAARPGGRLHGIRTPSPPSTGLDRHQAAGSSEPIYSGGSTFGAGTGPTSISHSCAVLDRATSFLSSIDQ